MILLAACAEKGQVKAIPVKMYQCTEGRGKIEKAAQQFLFFGKRSGKPLAQNSGPCFRKAKCSD